MRYKKLSEITGNAGVKLAQIPTRCSVHCPMHTALSTLRELKGISTLVVGMPECCWYSRFVLKSEQGADLHYTYTLDANEVVFGCAKGFEKALRVMREEGAERIVVVKTCVPALIGEDLEGICEQIEEETTMRLKVIDVAHFKRNGYLSGFSLVYEALAHLLPAAHQVRQVNLLGKPEGDEAQRLRACLYARYTLASFHPGKLDTWKQLSQGCLSLVFSALYIPMAETLRRHFGIAYVDLSAIATQEQASECYREIAERLQINVEVIGENPTDNRMRIPLTYVSTISHPDILTMVAILEGFGMKAGAIHLEEMDGVQAKRGHALKFSDPQVFYKPESGQHGKTGLIFDDGRFVIEGNAVLKAMEKIGFERIETLGRLVNDAIEEREKHNATE